VAETGQKCLFEAAMVTIVADRESDIYEEWARIPDERTHLLTRACRDRTLATGDKLYARIAAQSAQGIHRFDVPAWQAQRPPSDAGSALWAYHDSASRLLLGQERSAAD
jgi:hypothetical protein